jgi:hypothetical protein
VVATGGSDGQGAGAAAFAVYSANGGASWKQGVLQLPDPGTVITALAAGTGGFAAAGQYGQAGQRKAVLWEVPFGGSTWARVHLSGVTAPGASKIHVVTALGMAGAALTGVGPVEPEMSRRAAVFILRGR